ncbi:hypothetical protein AGMMS49938_01290 [Fibrobacterales bacterium]|nr:hypothetical protein AGMMS49938_01290 [Fibrobacterales bacterium]
MKYYYSEVDNIVLTHSDMEISPFGRFVRVYFERSNNSGFDFAEGSLPECEFNKSYGFSEDEIFSLQRYLRNNSPLIWEYAQKGGGESLLKKNSGDYLDNEEKKIA